MTIFLMEKSCNYCFQKSERTDSKNVTVCFSGVSKVSFWMRETMLLERS